MSFILRCLAAGTDDPHLPAALSNLCHVPKVFDKVASRLQNCLLPSDFLYLPLKQIKDQTTKKPSLHGASRQHRCAPPQIWCKRLSRSKLKYSQKWTHFHGALNICFPELCEKSLRWSQRNDISRHTTVTQMWDPRWWGSVGKMCFLLSVCPTLFKKHWIDHRISVRKGLWCVFRSSRLLFLFDRPDTPLAYWRNCA